jgi:pimeloyl-ACP methyl ester carboxylesterase
MKEIWEKFVNNKVTAHGVGDSVGHFVNEEAPEECTEALLEWMKTLV